MNVYEIVTAKVIEQLEKGVIPWKKSWQGSDMPINYVSRKKYRGVNVLLLDRGGEWLTFKQCQKLGGKIKKGEKGSLVCFFKFADKEETRADGTTSIVKIPTLRYYNVWHISQCEGIETKIEMHSDNKPIDTAERIKDDYISRCNVGFYNVAGTDRAFYRPANDTVNVPCIEQFSGEAEYYATVFHELVHSTGAKNRLGRLSDNFTDAAFGSENYSKEELVAELGSAMLMNICGIDTADTFNNSASYISGWLEALKNDKNLIVSASCKAQKAVDLILGISHEEDEE